MRKETRIEGNDFTRRRIKSEKVDLNRDDPAEVAKAFQHLSDWGRAPWSANSPLLARIQSDLDAEIAKKGSNRFEPRTEVGWYLKELTMYAQMIEANAAKGDTEWVAHSAAHWGMLFAELQLWQARGETFEVGLKFSGRQGRRKGDQQSRVTAVDALVAAGKGVTKAFAEVASKERVSVKTIEADYYKAKAPKSRD